MASSSKHRSTITILGVVVALGVVGTLAWRRASMTAPVTFRTARVDRGSVEATVTATGALNAVVTVQVGSQVSGAISKLGADFNSQVNEGQIIAQIDPTRFKANLAQAEAALKSAEAALVHAEVNLHEAKIELSAPDATGRKRFKGLLLGLEGNDVVFESQGIRAQFPFHSIADAKLVLTDKLIEEDLKARKAPKQ